MCVLSRLPIARVAGVGLQAVVLLLVLSGAAGAVDGVREINQTCAENGGCFAGDTAGFPVTIVEAGSYRLTSDLVLPDATTNAIQIEAHLVGLDLNQFSIVRAGCLTLVLGCAPTSGNGAGVISVATSPTPKPSGITVENGRIVGMAIGTDLGGQSRVSRVAAIANRIVGIGVGGSDSTVENSQAVFNGESGELPGGIVAGISATVRGNVVSDNQGAGIIANNGALVESNVVHDNDGVGLSLTSSAGYRGNVLSSNGAGTVTGGIDLGGNGCDGNTTCP